MSYVSAMKNVSSFAIIEGFNDNKKKRQKRNKALQSCQQTPVYCTKQNQMMSVESTVLLKANICVSQFSKNAELRVQSCPSNGVIVVDLLDNSILAMLQNVFV